MNIKSKIRHSSLAHLLLMSDAGNSKKSRMLLSKRERRNFGLLSVRFAIDVITRIVSRARQKEKKRQTRLSKGVFLQVGIGLPLPHIYLRVVRKE